MKMFFICNRVNKQSRGDVIPKNTVRFRFIIGLGAALILLFLGAVPHLQAATLTVMNTNDVADPADPAYLGSLRQAIIDANTASGADVIDFATGVTGTITLTTSLPPITGDLDIIGPGEATMSVSGNDVDGIRPFTIGDAVGASAVVTISGLTVEKGHAAREGGGILNYGKLTLKNSTVRNNEAGYGGGILNYSVLTLEYVTVSNNMAKSGGGIFNNESTVTLINNSHVDGNTAQFDGGGIESSGGQLTLTNSTVNNNTVESVGGGIKIYNGQLTLTDSTVNNNTANYQGSTIDVKDSTVTLINSHVDYNSDEYGAVRSLGGGNAHHGRQQHGQLQLECRDLPQRG